METGTTTDGVNLRAAPNKDAGTKILRLLTKGTVITILDHNSAPWLHVQTSDSIVGYVLGDYVQLNTSQPAAGAPAAASTPATSSAPATASTPATSSTPATASTPATSAAPATASTPATSSTPAASTPATSGLSATPPMATSASPDLTNVYNYIASIPDNYTIPQGYHDFQAQASKIGLPAPFDVPPALLADPSKLPVNGFGPNSFALNNWSNWYTRVCGMHNGLDHNVPLGTPLLALSDAIVVGDRGSWPFLASRYEKTLVIWCLLPPSITDANGGRMLSNVLVAYGHMSNNSVVQKGQMVKAGQLIGYSGYPHNEDPDTGKMVEQPGNAHLHMEVHLISGDNSLPLSRNGLPKLLRAYKGDQPFFNSTPFNPILFFSERLVKYQLHQAVVVGRGYPSAADLGKVAPPVTNWPPLDFFNIAYFQYPGVRYANIIWKAQNPPPWPKGVYGLDDALQRIQNFVPFQPYPIPASM